MATIEEKTAQYQEIANRGLQSQLSEEKLNVFNEAVKRGLIVLPTDSEEIQAAEAVQSQGVLLSPEEFPSKPQPTQDDLKQAILGRQFSPAEIELWKRDNLSAPKRADMKDSRVINLMRVDLIDDLEDSAAIAQDPFTTDFSNLGFPAEDSGANDYPVEELQGFIDNSPEYIRDATGATGDFVRSVGTGLEKFGSGVGQLGFESAEAVGIPGAEEAGDEWTTQWQSHFDAEAHKGSDNPIASTIGDVTGQIVPLFLSPIKAPNTLLPSLKALSPGKIIKSAAEFAALEGALFKGEDESRLEAMESGAKTGAVVTALFGSAGKAVDAVTRSSAAKVASHEMRELSKKFKVDLTVGQLRNSRGVQMVEGILDQIPIVGMQRFTQRQYLGFKDAAERMVKQLGGTIDDVGLELSKGLKATLKSNKAKVKGLYDAVQRQVGGGAQRLDNLTAASKAISKEVKENIEFLGQTSAGKTAVMAEEATKISKVFSPILDRLGNQIQKGVNTPTKTYAQLRSLRTEYNRLAHKAFEGIKSGTSTLGEYKAYRSLAKAVEADMEVAVGKAGGKAVDLYTKADAAYLNLVKPFKGGKLRQSISDGFDTDNILASFIRRDAKLGGGTNAAKQLFSNTGEGGRQAIKFSVLRSAWDEASKIAFDPHKFIKILNATSKAQKVVFSKSEQAVLEGFAKLVESAPTLAQATSKTLSFPARKVGHAAINVAKGAAVTAAAGTAALTGMLPAAVAILGGTAGLSILLTSNAGRAILHGASRKGALEGSKGVELIARANAEISRITADMAKGYAVLHGKDGDKGE